MILQPAVIDKSLKKQLREDPTLKLILDNAPEIQPRIQAGLSRTHAALVKVIVKLLQERLNLPRDFVDDIVRLIALQGSKIEYKFEAKPLGIDTEDRSPEVKLDRIRKIANAADIDIEAIKKLEKKKCGTSLEDDETTQMERAHVVATYGH